jgi:Flp pilus assembly protein TadB
MIVAKITVFNAFSAAVPHDGLCLTIDQRRRRVRAAVRSIALEQHEQQHEQHASAERRRRCRGHHRGEKGQQELTSTRARACGLTAPGVRSSVVALRLGLCGAPLACLPGEKE